MANFPPGWRVGQVARVFTSPWVCVRKEELFDPQGGRRDWYVTERGDLVGIFGKGHEQSMNLDGKKELPWSDLEAAERAIKKGRKG